MTPSTPKTFRELCQSADQFLMTLTGLVTDANDQTACDTPQPMVSVHNCPDGGLGIADIVGGIFNAPPPEPR